MRRYWEGGHTWSAPTAHAAWLLIADDSATWRQRRRAMARGAVRCGCEMVAAVLRSRLRCVMRR